MKANYQEDRKTAEQTCKLVNLELDLMWKITQGGFVMQSITANEGTYFSWFKTSGEWDLLSDVKFRGKGH